MSRTDDMDLNDSYTQVRISNPLPVTRENSYATVTTRLVLVDGCYNYESYNRFCLKLKTFHHMILPLCNAYCQQWPIDLRNENCSVTGPQYENQEWA